MKNRIRTILHKQAEMSRQLMVLGTVLFVAGTMSVATIRLAQAAADADTNMAQNVSAGTLAITANTQLNLSSGAPGDITSANTGAVTPIAISDTRGNLDGWDVTGYFNTNFNSVGSVEMTIASQMSWYPGDMTVQNNTGNNDGVNKGANGSFSGVEVGNSKTLATSNNGHVDNGAGSFNVWNLKFNYSIPPGAQATDYTTSLRLTIA